MPTPIENSEIVRSSQIFFINLTETYPQIITKIILKLDGHFLFAEISPVDFDLSLEPAMMMVGDGKIYNSIDDITERYGIRKSLVFEFNIARMVVKLFDRSNPVDQFICDNDIDYINLTGQDGKSLVIKRGRDDYEVPCLFLMDEAT